VAFSRFSPRSHSCLRAGASHIFILATMERYWRRGIIAGRIAQLSLFFASYKQPLMDRAAYLIPHRVILPR